MNIFLEKDVTNIIIVIPHVNININVEKMYEIY